MDTNVLIVGDSQVRYLQDHITNYPVICFRGATTSDILHHLDQQTVDPPKVRISHLNFINTESYTNLLKGLQLLYGSLQLLYGSLQLLNGSLQLLYGGLQP